MNLARELRCLTHIASQLTYTWLPVDPSLAGQLSIGHVDPLFLHSQENWLEIISYLSSYQLSASAPYHWLPRYMGQFDGRGEDLAAATYRHLSTCRSQNAHYLLLGDDNYPSRLNTIPDPPHGLTILGEISHLYNVASPRRPAAAIVGSRKASPFAITESFKLGKDLALANALVISGGAYGCDIAAHRGTLASGVTPCPAIVVFAGGLQNFYPSGNLALFRLLLEEGATFISERLWWAPARPLDFPVRNRIVSGMSDHLFLIQAAQKSGAAITTRIAADQGRDVWVLKHPAHDVRASGNKIFLHDGAREFGPLTDLANPARTL